jgi:DsbC/DsbD-like thiol-disulfide interchange protein
MFLAGFDHVCAHNEFNGEWKVSSLNRAIMMWGIDRLRRSAAVYAIVASACLGHAVAGQDASPWDGDARSAVRLLAGSWPQEEGAPVPAGIEIRLKPGWHTYWRYPGDAGVPPRFDFGGSRNVKAVTLSWPAPSRIREHGLSVIGYVSDLILPLAIIPKDRTEPVALHLKLDYAVCETLCVPQQATAQLLLGAGPSSWDGALARARSRVPRKQAVGAPFPLTVRSIQRAEGASRSRVLIDVAAPRAASLDLFVEGPNPDWALPLPTAAADAPGDLRRFAFDLEGAPPQANYNGALLTITAVTAEDAIEVTAPLQ